MHGGRAGISGESISKEKKLRGKDAVGPGQKGFENLHRRTQKTRNLGEGKRNRGENVLGKVSARTKIPTPTKTIPKKGLFSGLIKNRKKGRRKKTEKNPKKGGPESTTRKNPVDDVAGEKKNDRKKISSGEKKLCKKKKGGEGLL